MKIPASAFDTHFVFIQTITCLPAPTGGNANSLQGKHLEHKIFRLSMSILPDFWDPSRVAGKMDLSHRSSWPRSLTRRQ